MLNTICAVIDLIILIIKNLFEQNATVKKQNADLHKEAKDAILSRDPSRITSIFDRLHRK